MLMELLRLSSDRFVEYLLERPDVAGVWDNYVRHPFVLAMGNGTLPVESFKGYLVQDYLFLVCAVLSFASGPGSYPETDAIRPSQRSCGLQGQGPERYCLGEYSSPFPWHRGHFIVVSLAKDIIVRGSGDPYCARNQPPY